ncbi:hypothetical protein BWI97_26195 [Siphonobacter sp. BAB-5405]|uniref:AAA family ATPase n=1 Tax=Siphonobacter sp. BAB-5405 TaxID=1864825 RepID=UPI000C80C9EE|nr:ATP-binding protein [Siphonobacter sp. BAB-5405]PMD86653.1 hypothetical protein BWI97_26195 [Siphonobacter sp. BAB-5405]
MEAPLPLQRISVFMPQRMRDEELTAIFVARQDLLAELISSLDQESKESIPQHHLIIGQRGMGKSTLLKRLDIELRTGTYKSRFIPFSYPEEQYNIDRFSKFWLNTLDALADTLQTEGEDPLVNEIDEQVAAFTTLKDEAELSKRAYQLLIAITGRLKRRPVFLLDNINLIFERLSEENQSSLRKLISEPGAPIFIGASATAFDKNFDYEAPFYDAFIVHYLHQLSFEETLTLFRHLAKVSNQTELQSQLQGENLARLQTLHQLTGGNIRTIVILFTLVAQGFSADVFLDLEALLDQMTPFYKAKFEELSNQSQVVVDALAIAVESKLIWRYCVNALR